MDKKKIFIVVFFLAAMAAAGVGLKMYQADSEPVYEKMDYLHVLFQGEEISALYDDGQKLWVGLKDGLRTIHRETGSLKWTAAAVLLPTAAGILLCVTANGLYHLLGLVSHLPGLI